jgi:hypothetical protein
MGIQLKNLSGQAHHPREELVPIDTGYSEEVLVPYRIFERLQLERWLLPGPHVAQGSTVTGEVVDFIQTRALITIPNANEQYPVIAQTFIGNTRFLIGRAFLRHFKVLLDGPEQQTCLVQTA